MFISENLLFHFNPIYGQSFLFKIYLVFPQFLQSIILGQFDFIWAERAERLIPKFQWSKIELVPKF